MPSHRCRQAIRPRADRALQALNRKLHAWELQHLRELTAELHAELESTQARLSDTLQRLNWAEDDADRWRDDFLQAIEDTGATPGLLPSGQVVAIPAGALLS
jgi:ABC-type transporter Mla subunit MlaD